MTSDDYIASMRRLNRNLFKADKLKITPEGLEEALRRAFDSGFESGYEQGQNEKSLFEKVFG